MDAVNNVPSRQYNAGIPAIKTISPSVAINTFKRESGFLKHCTQSAVNLFKEGSWEGKMRYSYFCETHQRCPSIMRTTKVSMIQMQLTTLKHSQQILMQSILTQIHETFRIFGMVQYRTKYWFKILILKYLTTYHKQNDNWLWARLSSSRDNCLLCRANIWIDVNCPIVHPFHMSIWSPSAFPSREIIIDHIHASNTQKQHGVKMSSSLSPSWRRWWWKKTRRWKKWTNCRRGKYMRRERNIWRHI